MHLSLLNLTNLEALYKYNNTNKTKTGLFKTNKDAIKAQIKVYNTETTGILLHLKKL